MQIIVMVTQEWAYFKSQLDMPKSKRIKAHVVNPDTGRSYCGLQNHTDEGEITWQKFLNYGDWACSKCRRLTTRAAAYCECGGKYEKLITGAYVCNRCMQPKVRHTL